MEYIVIKPRTGPSRREKRNICVAKLYYSSKLTSILDIIYHSFCSFILIAINMPNFSPYCFVYNNNSNNNNNNSKYCNNYSTANKFLFIVLLLNIFVFSSTVTSSNVFQHTTETIEKCLIEDKDDLCLISRKNEFYYRWCNLETVERIHMTEYGVPEERQTPWLVIGRYAEEPSNANTQFFFNGRLCPNSPDPYHAEVTFTCCPKEQSVMKFYQLMKYDPVYILWRYVHLAIARSPPLML